eukprot:scaffold13120_cov107-Isochrysis_galbana.AAC.1
MLRRVGGVVAAHGCAVTLTVAGGGQLGCTSGEALPGLLQERVPRRLGHGRQKGGIGADAGRQALQHHQCPAEEEHARRHGPHQQLGRLGLRMTARRLGPCRISPVAALCGLGAPPCFLGGPFLLGRGRVPLGIPERPREPLDHVEGVGGGRRVDLGAQAVESRQNQ